MNRYVVCAIIQKDDRILLAKQSLSRPPFPNMWHTPGGDVKNTHRAEELVTKNELEDEYFHKELVREIHEGLGLKVENIHCIVPEFRPTPRESNAYNKLGEMTHYTFLEYLCDYAGGSIHPDSEYSEAQFFDKEELKKLDLTPPSREMYDALGWL